MASSGFDALTREQIVQSNSLATITENCVVIRALGGRSKTIISLSRLSEVRRIKVTHPKLLVVSAGLGVLAAAAFCSKQGDGSSIPIALVGLMFLIAYFATRRAYLIFVIGHEETRTPIGTLSEAAILTRTISSAQKKRTEEVPDLGAAATS